MWLFGMLCPRRAGEDCRARRPGLSHEEHPMNATGSAGPHVRLTSGSVRGRTEDGLAVFRGMPFARPPVGELRLAAPMPVEPWEGVREAVAFGPPPPQSSVMGAPAARDTDGDWLTVDVWSPTLAPLACLSAASCRRTVVRARPPRSHRPGSAS